MRRSQPLGGREKIQVILSHTGVPVPGLQSQAPQLCGPLQQLGSWVKQGYVHAGGLAHAREDKRSGTLDLHVSLDSQSPGVQVHQNEKQGM